MKKKGLQTLVATVLVGTMVGNTAFAAPSISELEEQQQQAQNEVSSLQEELTEVISEINELEEKLIEKGEEILQATDDLDAAKEKEKKQYEAMKKRIRMMYEEGSTSAFEKIVTAESLGDLINQAEYVYSIHTYDRKQLTEYQNTKKKIADLKETLEEEQKELEQTQDAFEDKKADLNETLEEKKDEVKDLDQQLEAAREAAAREAAERAAREAAEKAAREAAEKVAREEEERRRQEELANSSNNNASQSDSTSSDEGKSNENSSSSSNVSSGDTSVAQAIVNAAYSQLGTPYVWGGTSPNRGLDCSGLTQYCHRVAGISIPRTSGPQGSGGKTVSNPQPGDIVCYSGHVGIYIGNGQMIHAPQPGDVVKVQKVYGSPWYRRYW